MVVVARRQHPVPHASGGHEANRGLLTVKVLVTGAAGFLGSHLADDFISMGHSVVGCDNMLGGDRQNLPEGILFEEADCCDVQAMTRLSRGVDLIYHCAAIATEGLSVFSP